MVTGLVSRVLITESICLYGPALVLTTATLFMWQLVQSAEVKLTRKRICSSSFKMCILTFSPCSTSVNACCPVNKFNLTTGFHQFSSSTLTLICEKESRRRVVLLMTPASPPSSVHTVGLHYSWCPSVLTPRVPAPSCHRTWATLVLLYLLISNTLLSLRLHRLLTPPFPLLLFIQSFQGHIPPILTLYQRETASKGIPQISTLCAPPYSFLRPICCFPSFFPPPPLIPIILTAHVWL